MSVTDLSASIDWYHQVFGFEKVEEGVRNGLPWAIVSLKDFSLCLYQQPEKLAPGSSTNHQIDHWGFRISDKEAWVQTVKVLGLKLQYGGEVGYPNSTSWYVIDPSGYEIEVSYVVDNLPLFA